MTAQSVATVEASERALDPPGLDGPAIFGALRDLGPELLATEAQELWAWGQREGKIEGRGIFPFGAPLPSRFLHLLCGQFMFNFPCPIDELERRLHASFLSHLSLMKRETDLDLALGFYDDATKAIVARGLSQWLGRSRSIPEWTEAAALAFIRSASPKDGHGPVGVLSVEQLREGLERCSDGVAVSMLIAALRRHVPPGGWEDPFVRRVRDRLGLECSQERPRLDEASRRAVVEAAVASFAELYADSEEKIAFLGLAFPGHQLGSCCHESMAGQLWWAAACARTSVANEAREVAREALDPELQSLLNVLVTVEERSHDGVLLDLLYQIAQKNNAGSWFSSLASELVGSVDAGTHRMLSQEELLLPIVKQWNEEYASIPEHQEMIDLILERVPDGAFSNFYILNVQHLLGGVVPYVNAQIAKGAEPENIYNVAISYSDSAKAELKLRTKRAHVASAPRLVDFEPTLKKVMRELIVESKRTGRKILVSEDGGTVALLLATDPEFRGESWRFVIAEQTKRGLWVALQMIQEHPEFECPAIVKVCSARSKEVSDGDVAKSTMPRLRRIVEARAALLRHDPEATDVPKTLSDVPRAAINGYGQLGAQVAEELAWEMKRPGESIEEARARIAIWDSDPKLRNRARSAGFHVPRRHADLEKGRDIVIGVTGSPTFRTRTAARMDPYTLMASLSSKRSEAEEDLLEKLISVSPEDMQKRPFRGYEILGHYRPRTVLGTETQLEKPNEHSLILIYVYDGQKVRPGPIVANMFQPINFDHTVFALPPKEGAFIRSLMLLGLYQASLIDGCLGPVDLDPRLDQGALEDREKIEGALRQAKHLAPEAK